MHAVNNQPILQKAEERMRILLQTQFTGSLDAPSGHTHVLVDFDPRHVLDMRACLAGVMSLPQLYAVEFFDYSPQPIEAGVLDEELAWLDPEVEVQIVPIHVSPTVADFRIAAPTIHYMPDGILWNYYEHHSGEPFETATIPWQFLEDAHPPKGKPRAQVSS